MGIRHAISPGAVPEFDARLGAAYAGGVALLRGDFDAAAGWPLSRMIADQEN